MFIKQHGYFTNAKFQNHVEMNQIRGKAGFELKLEVRPLQTPKFANVWSISYFDTPSSSPTIKRLIFNLHFRPEKSGPTLIREYGSYCMGSGMGYLKPEWHKILAAGSLEFNETVTQGIQRDNPKLPVIVPRLL